ncbi:MAG TPA: S8 family serine peptidase [Pyrinomonadaceae bacterium]|nr:S8 family serine peptidase [Pyrinomonadaceae bacterium]
MSRKFLRPLVLLALVAALLFPCAPALQTVRADGGGSGEDGYVTNEINVKLLRASDLQAVSDQFHLQLVEQFGTRPIYRMRVLDGTDSKVKATAVAADTSRVEYAEANYTAGAPEGSGLTWSVASSWTSGLTWSVGGGGHSGKDDYVSQWAVDKIRLVDAHRATKGAGVIVAVLDTGVDRRHPALAGRLLRGHDFVDDDDDPSEVLPTCPAGSTATDPRECGPYGHGTHVAGLVALAAPEARIMPLRVLDSHGVGNMWVLAEAIKYALDPDGDPTTDDGADVINMSLATFQNSRVLREVVGDACDTGVPSPYSKVVVVAAAGNHGTATPMFPAAENFDGELSIAASQPDDTLAPFSERDDRVVNDVMSPGVQITSSVPGSGTGVWAGTSMAAPIVAGVAALVRAASPELSADLVKDRIRSAAVRPSPEQPVKRRVDASNAVVPFVNFGVNPIDNTGNFVRQQYLDFLNRAPDKSGGDFWSQEVNQCNGDAACVQFRRTNTSGAFFLSIEFRDTGYFVYRLYKAAFGNLAADKPVPVRYEDFMPDTQRIGEGVVVNSAGWEQKLAANRDAFVLDFVARARFTSAFPTTLTPAQFADQLFTNAGLTPSAAERQAVVDEFGGAATSADTAARARVLKRVAENASLVAQERNRAFVLMQYFGYLRRNPDDAPEAKRDFSGYSFWLGKLEDNGGDFIRAEMVRAFIESIEYRGRFRQ